MRDNLVISGIAECVNETEEDIRATLSKLFDEVIMVKGVRIARCHRLYAPGNRQTKPRNIVVRLCYYPDRMSILRSAKNLKGHKPPIFINEQFPAEIMRRQRILRPILKEARNKGLRATLSRDKLVVDGKAYTVDNIQNIPFRTFDINTMKTNSHVLFSGALSPYSNFHSCKFVIDDDEYCSLEQYFQAQKAVHAKDFYHHAVIMSTTDPVSMLRAGKLISVDAKWTAIQTEIMQKGLVAKFSQNQSLLKEILSTGTLNFAEANEHDSHWGIGKSLRDPDIQNSSMWLGKNNLGKLLNNVRDILAQ